MKEALFEQADYAVDNPIPESVIEAWSNIKTESCKEFWLTQKQVISPGEPFVETPGIIHVQKLVNVANNPTSATVSYGCAVFLLPATIENFSPKYQVFFYEHKRTFLETWADETIISVFVASKLEGKMFYPFSYCRKSGDENKTREYLNTFSDENIELVAPSLEDIMSLQYRTFINNKDFPALNPEYLRNLNFLRQAMRLYSPECFDQWTFAQKMSA